jgi:dCTP diphosphatase
MKHEENITSSESELFKLREALRRFASDRNWDQFHSPKNLAIALIVEAGELLEHFQWLKDADSLTLPPAIRSRVEEEVADVFLYLVRLADKLDVDLVQVARAKLEVNASRYPAEKARGSSKKYTEL